MVSSKRTKITTQVDFPREWGLGTSSTLVSLLAQHTAVSPYQLLADTFGGSGYDIACAIADGPIRYRLADGIPYAQPTQFKPPFLDQLYLVYSGKKKTSEKYYGNIWISVD